MSNMCQRWQHDHDWFEEDAKKNPEKYIAKNDEIEVTTEEMEKFLKDFMEEPKLNNLKGDKNMFQMIEVGQRVVHRKTKVEGVLTAKTASTYAVKISGSDGEVVHWEKHDVYALKEDKEEEEEKEEKREQELVHVFHKAFKYPQSSKPVALSADDIFKRIVFIQEELIELLAASVDTLDEFHTFCTEMEEKKLDAMRKEVSKMIDRTKASEGTAVTDNIDFEKMERERTQRIVEQADALTDINVFVQGTGDMMGVQLFPLFEIVMKANMSKLDDNGKPIYNEFGKIQKSHNFTPPEPQLLEEIQRQIKAAEDK